MAKRLQKALSEARIDLDAQAADAREVLAILAGLMAHSAAEAQTLAAALLAREQTGATALGNGVAVPHARVAGMTEIRAAFVRTRTPSASPRRMACRLTCTLGSSCRCTPIPSTWSCLAKLPSFCLTSRRSGPCARPGVPPRSDRPCWSDRHESPDHCTRTVRPDQRPPETSVGGRSQG
ncbi:MAG: PTS sugar transporter subunit IIA [Ahniella sp.]|nr:PTS sugar transporter subunit IIA [Ahniella sp.]